MTTYRRTHPQRERPKVLGRDTEDSQGRFVREGGRPVPRLDLQPDDGLNPALVLAAAAEKRLQDVID